MPDLYQRRVREKFEALKIGPDTIRRAIIWSHGREVAETNPQDPDGHKLVGINVMTFKNGVIRVSEGDYLVMFRSDFESIPASEFEAQFEKVSGDV